MTLTADLSRLPRTSIVEDLARRSSALTATGLTLLLLLVPLGLSSLLDPRDLGGHAVWDKPMRFALALGVYSLTLAFFAGWVSERTRAGRLFRGSVAAGIVGIAFEQVWITVQAARGAPSHFNMGTPFEAAMWAFMGIGALVLTAMAAVIGWLVWRSPRSGLAPALRASATLGLILTLPLTLATAGTLAALGGALVGETPGLQAGATQAGMAFMGWSREVGDLRVPHFFAAHALHAVPLASAALMPVFGRERTGPSVWIAGAYSAFVLGVFIQALTGRSF